MAKKRQTYETVQKQGSYKVWAGCGDGRQRWCGAVYNFSYEICNGGPLIDMFRCIHNHRQECPQPKPEKELVGGDSIGHNPY